MCTISQLQAMECGQVVMWGAHACPHGAMVKVCTALEMIVLTQCVALRWWFGGLLHCLHQLLLQGIDL
jgi:hypothetical protein